MSPLNNLGCQTVSSPDGLKWDLPNLRHKLISPQPYQVYRFKMFVKLKKVTAFTFMTKSFHTFGKDGVTLHFVFPLVDNHFVPPSTTSTGGPHHLESKDG